MAIEKFDLRIENDCLIDLTRRLKATRWPDPQTVRDLSQGVPLISLQSLCHYWQQDYDWRRCEAKLNAFGQFRMLVDGLRIHFLHIRSPEPDALPLLITHGWPGSVLEFHKAIEPLCDPALHGGSPGDAFHLVIPSLPGYGFSDKPESTGWGVHHIAKVWLSLMKKLGYDRFVAQGGDWGASVTTALGVLRPPECLAIHLNMPLGFPDENQRKDMTPDEAAAMSHLDSFMLSEAGYMIQQKTKPQTLGYGLTDSPAGQAAWIYEKLQTWSDCNGDVLSVFSMDEILDNIMLYWLPSAATSSARLYWESAETGFVSQFTDIPTGVSIFPKEILRLSRRWTERSYPNLFYWNELDRGGHFPALEQPALFVQEMRNCFREVR